MRCVPTGSAPAEAFRKRRGSFPRFETTPGEQSRSCLLKHIRDVDSLFQERCLAKRHSLCWLCDHTHTDAQKHIRRHINKTIRLHLDPHGHTGAVCSFCGLRVDLILLCNQFLFASVSVIKQTFFLLNNKGYSVLVCKQPLPVTVF